MVKPIKALTPFSIWLMRLALLLFSFAFMADMVKEPNMKSADFWLSITFIIGTVLLFAGSLAEGASLTMWGSIVICLSSIIKIGITYPHLFNKNNSLMLMMLAIGLFFISTGNKN